MAEAIDQHTLITRLKDLAIELGRTPTMTEFSKTFRGARFHTEKHFNNFSTLVQAAGLEPGPMSRVKISNEVFKKDLASHLESYTPTPAKERGSYERVLFIPDTHFPFAHMPTLEKIYRFCESNRPDVIVQMGDLFDCYSHAKFPRSHNVFTPREEQTLSRSMAEEFWKTLRSVAPAARCVQMVGNHDLRPLKRVLESYPEVEDWIKKAFTELMAFEGVQTIYDPREELILGGDVMVIHGYRSKLGEHRDFALYNAVCGHQHVGGVSFRQIRGRVLWELNCGLAGDPEAKGLTYQAQRISNWTLGWGWLDEYGPRFIHA